MVTRCLPCAKLLINLRICKWIFVGCGVGEFNTDFHGWDMWFSTDFHRFIISAVVSLALADFTDFGDIWAAVSLSLTDFTDFADCGRLVGDFNTDFHGWYVWFSTDFHRFLAAVRFYRSQISRISQIVCGKVFHGLSVRWNYLCYLCNLCEVYLAVKYFTDYLWDEVICAICVICVRFLWGGVWKKDCCVSSPLCESSGIENWTRDLRVMNPTL